MRAIATLLTLMLLVAAGPARSQWYFRCDAIRLSVPGLSGDAWRILLDRDWSARDRADPTRFDAERAIRQASLAPLDTDYPDDMVRFENYQPSRSATDEERDAYDSARQLYLRHDWKAAVAGFDAIVEAKSPFAAAAAYTAARAALYDAEFADGFQRIERIVGDPALREMHQAAHHLIGTLANQTGGSPLIAARLGEILHLVTVPLEPRCRSAELHALSDEAADDLSIMLGHAFPHSYRDFDEKWSSHTRGVIQRLAAVEPMLDMIRILAAATPYRGDHWIEPFFSERLSTPGFSIDSQHVLSGVDIDPVEFTSHARTRLAATGHPIWAYALASRSADPGDLPSIIAAHAKVRELPIDPQDRQALGAALAEQEARILLMSGRLDEAISVAETMRDLPPRPYVPSLGELAQAGTRYLLGRRDLAGARRWAGIFGQLGTIQQPLLAMTWEELLQPGMAKRNAPLPNATASLLDLLPVDRLVALARTDGLAASWRRPMLSAGWLRLFLLGREAEFRALFPDMRAAFPELIADLDEIDAAWLPQTKRRLTVRMLLRLPGLTPRVLWARPDPDYYRSSIVNLAMIDPKNPSDGNWWCGADPDHARQDAFAMAFVAPLSSPNFFVRKEKTAKLGRDDEFYNTQDPTSVLNSWLGWHPLLRGLDRLEPQVPAPGGPRMLAEAAVGWAENSNAITRGLGWDASLPETLALAVRATRYGCRRQGAMGDVSRAAWQSLQRLYSGTEWARRTPYWFDLGGK